MFNNFLRTQNIITSILCSKLILFNLEKTSPNGMISPTVTPALAYCNKLFTIKKELADLPYQGRFEMRKAKAETCNCRVFILDQNKNGFAKEQAWNCTYISI